MASKEKEAVINCRKNHTHRYDEKSSVFTCVFCDDKYIKVEALKRLQFCNSKHLPDIINHNGILKQWVGIGWNELRERPTGKEIRIVD